MKKILALVLDVAFNVNTFIRRFKEEARELDPKLSEFVYIKLFLFS